jgi:hypothetical protein
MTTLGATTGQYGAAILVRHARAKAMLVHTFPVSGLKSSLHGWNSNLKDEGII